MGRIKKFFSNLKLRNKFIIAYALLLIVPLLLTGVLFYNWIATVTRKQTEEIAFQSLKQAELHIAYIIDQVENLALMVFWDSDLREILKRKGTPLYDQVEEYEAIMNMVMRMEANSKIQRVRLYVLDDKIYAHNNQNIFALSTLQENPYFQKMNNENNTGWTESYTFISSSGRQEKVVSYMMMLNDFDNFGQIIGCISIDVLEEEFFTILKEIKIGDNGFALISNSEGDIISKSYVLSNKLDKIVDMFSTRSRSEKIQHSVFNNFNWRETSFSVIDTPVNNSDWEVVYIMPTREIMKNVDTSIKFTMIIIIVCILLAAAIAVIVSNKITLGIHNLIDRMEKLKVIGIKTIEDDIVEYSNDEIVQLQYHYNQMVDRIRNLVVENYEVQLQRREAQLIGLQAQINPHFLYNVLDSINWMAIRAKAMNISDMVTDLGQFYRIGLSGGKEVISIGEELEHVKTYLKIQKVRFGETIEVIFAVSEEVLDYPIVKLVLQPIVENAIIHGILAKPSQKGIIKICSKKSDKGILIQIMDDGIGLNFEKVNYILSDSESKFTKGFGIKNVNERIKLYFGQQYGVEIRREKDQWTVVDIILPDQWDNHS